MNAINGSNDTPVPKFWLIYWLIIILCTIFGVILACITTPGASTPLNNITQILLAISAFGILIGAFIMALIEINKSPHLDSDPEGDHHEP